MSRIRTLFTIILPSMLAGGLVFTNASGYAAAGGDDALTFWPVVVADSGSTAGAVRRVPPVPPAPPAPPLPPPRHPGVGGPRGPHGVSISIKDGKVRIDGVDRLVRQQIDAARQAVRTNPNIPPDVRARVLARLDKVKVDVDKRLANIKVTDMDQLGEEMEKMGEELEDAMEELEEELDKLGQKIGKDVSRDIARQFGKDFAKGFQPNIALDWDSGDDDIDAIPMTPDLDADDADLAGAIDGLKGLALRPQQRDAIAKIRAESDKAVTAAKQQIDSTSVQLEAALANDKSSDHDISKYVDQISQHEAAVRKARILAWVNARRVLDVDQRKKLEAAAANQP